MARRPHSSYQQMVPGECSGHLQGGACKIPLNLDLIWALALIATGSFVLFIQLPQRGRAFLGGRKNSPELRTTR